MENLEEVKRIWNEWQTYQTYLYSIGKPKNFKQNVDFYEGRHWEVKHPDLPEVTVNEIRAIIDVKTSNILGTPFSVHFSNSDDKSEELTVKLNNFDKAILKELNHDLLNRFMVNSNGIKGVFAIHYFWNEDKHGIQGLYKGGLEAEVLNPLNIAVSNPYEKDIQKMEWIIIGTPMKVNKAKKLAEDSGVSKRELEKIVPDDLDDLDDGFNQRTPDLNDNEKKQCVVLTRFFRQKGEVYFQQSTKNVLFGEARPLNTKITKKLLLAKEEKQKYETDPESSPVQDGNLESATEEDVWNLYPIEMASLTPSDSSIYGLSDTTDLIMLQKMLNVSFATGYKNSLDNVFPKYIAKQGALQQEITGEPNEIIIDHWKGNGFGIAKLEGIPLSNAQVGLPQMIIEFMKTVSNSRDVLQGESVGANMSAVAIQSLQVQAQKPIEQQRELFMLSLKRMAEIRLLFYKFYYKYQKFSYEMDDIEYENALEQSNYERMIDKTQYDVFKGEELLGKTFDIVTSVGRGTKYDAITAQETLNNLYLNGNIDKMDSDKLEQYVMAIDDNIMPYKDNLRKLIRKQRKSEKAQLTNQVAQLSQALQETQLENQQLKVYLEALKNEFSNKINVQNDLLKEQNERYKNADETLKKIFQTTHL